MPNHTILLIDYEPRSIERFRQPLVAAGYRVEIATDGIAGVEAFVRLNPDMVLVEAMIPKKHGFEVCQELKRSPHGRTTPVIITTGVYKGRKYRTQALHIYGCDEYIEKPIAAEQLLSIVHRFLGGTTPSSRVPVAAAVDAGQAEPAPPLPTRIQPTSGPRGVVGDLTEDEIMARLDAILPMPTPVSASASAEAVVEPEVEAPAAADFADPLAQMSAVDDDPFVQMQAELTAELGSLSTALALDPAPILEPIPDPIQSDQTPAPPLMETLPDPSVGGGVPDTAALPLSVGQVVSFDAKRSRKHKNKKEARKRPNPAPPPPAEPAPAPELPAPVQEEISIPAGSLVESALGEERPSRGVPSWVWIVAGAVVMVVAYLVFWRDGSTATSRRELDPPSVPAVAEESKSLEPPPTAEPAPTQPAESPGPEPHMVLNAVGPQPTRAVRPPAATPSKPAPRPVRRVEPEPPPAAADTPAHDLGPADAGVETIASPVSASASRDRTRRGDLVDLAEVDSAPITLARKLPPYSMQARQLKIQGSVIMRVLVNELGSVADVLVLSGIDGADLNDAAVNAARQWTYRPAMKDGVPVQVWTIEQVNFKL